MKEKKLIIEATFDERGMALKIGTEGEFTAIELLGAIEMAKIEVLKDNGNITDK